ncbi:histidine kinase [Dyadobacter sandarakinus]|uniref:Histidine kinase n=1 Tax=Dyadobacter sandarakinus TaxID=2747268 RepID=A0ABX7IDH6_9BACT|nr:histidine kinase [Dyadobacter sandarakinus]
MVAAGITIVSEPSCLSSLSGMAAVADDFSISFLLSVALSYGGFLSESYFDERISWIQYPVRRLVTTCLVYFVYVFCTSFIIIFLYSLLIKERFTPGNIPWKDLVAWTWFPMQVAFVLSFIFISRSFLMEWKKAAIEAEQLKTEQLAQQYQSLKDQLNPHFLFNSLNVLSNLVYENQDTAARFIGQLSRIYRYVLDVQQEELVAVSREAGFAESYLSLQKMRFEDALQYRINVPETAGYLPPLSLQLLLENAIKHNIASSEQPLCIEISAEDGCLMVRNNLQMKTSQPNESAGIGLSNIRKRYELLSDKAIEIGNNDGYFTVRLPVLTRIYDKNSPVAQL